MLGKEDFALIQALVRRGVYLCDIAQELGVHPKTVSRALRRGGAPSGKRKARGSLLAPYQARGELGFLGFGGDGGGAVIYTLDSLLVANCMFAVNHAGEAGGDPLGRLGRGGGFFTIGTGEIRFVNCTIAFNQSPGEGCGGFAFQASNTSVANSILWGNRSSTTSPGEIPPQIYSFQTTVPIFNSCLEGGVPIQNGSGNIANDPSFVAADSLYSAGLPGFVLRLGSPVPELSLGRRHGTPRASRGTHPAGDTRHRPQPHAERGS
jgi:helix-turn-helix protein